MVSLKPTKDALSQHKAIFAQMEGSPVKGPSCPDFDGAPAEIMPHRPADYFGLLALKEDTLRAL